MANRYDIKLVDNDLFISRQGDFVIDISDEQHVQDTINAFPGWWKENPEQGVGIRAYLGASIDTQQLQKNIRLQLQADGYVSVNPIVKLQPDGTVEIDPKVTT